MCFCPTNRNLSAKNSCPLKRGRYLLQSRKLDNKNKDYAKGIRYTVLQILCKVE